MRPPFLAIFFSLLALLRSASGALLPFGSDFPVTLKFTEDYADTIYFDQELQDYDTFTDTSLILDARASMTGVDSTTFNENTQFSLTIGGLSLSFPFSKGRRTTTEDGTTVTWDVMGYDPIDFDIAKVGEVSVHWNSVELLLQVNIADDPSDYSIITTEFSGEEEDIDDYVEAALQIGAYGFEARTAYVKGTATLFDEAAPDGQVFTELERVKVSGKFDSTPPEVEIVSPAANATLATTPITVSGTATDNVGVTSIELSVNGGAFLPVERSGGDAWSLAGVELVEGTNVLIARAADHGGNISMSTPRFVRLALITPLLVSATGNASGQVTSEFFPPLQYIPGQPPSTRTTWQQDGEMLTIVAEPGTDAVFDGWTSNEPLTPAQASERRLDFMMRPNLTLTAHFLLNPFALVRGSYSGLVASENPAHRGLITAKINRHGTFTATVQMGGLGIPVIGRFSNTGGFVTVVAQDGFIYTFDLTLNVTGSGGKLITGTITGGGVDATVSARLSPFKKGINPAPQAGLYTVLLPPSAENADPRFPVGIGFGRVTVSARGAARFLGRLGDGTPVVANARLSGDGVWPFYSSLYGNTGVVSGDVVFDLVNEAHDLSGQLDWFKPIGVAASKVHAEGFAGRSALLGARYIPPPAGERLFLRASSGSGLFSVDAPDAELLGLAVDLPARLSGNDKLTVTSPPGNPVQNIASTISRESGLLRGTFWDATTGQSRKFSGAIVTPKVNAAAGLFRRGFRTGSIQITPPAAP